jgi:hypothetical protein
VTDLAHELPRIALALACAVTAWRARRVPDLRPVALSLLALLALDVGRALSPPRPLDRALYLGWYAVEAAAVAGALWGRWGVCAAVAAGWWGHEVARLGWGTVGPWEWQAVWMVATACQCGAAARWARRAGRARRPPTEPETIALVVAAGSIADGVGPWVAGGGEAVARWELGRWQSAATWGCVVGVGVAWGARSRPRRATK